MNTLQLVTELNTLTNSVKRDIARIEEIRNILTASADYLKSCCGKWFEAEAEGCILYVKTAGTDICQGDFGSMQIYKLDYRHTSRRSWNAVCFTFTNIDDFKRLNVKEIQLPLPLEKYLYSLIRSSSCYDTSADCEFIKVYRTNVWRF